MKRSFTRGRVAGLVTATLVAACVTTAVPRAATAAVTGPPPQASSFDHALHWNDVLLKIYRSRRGADASPGTLARAAAMMNIAVHDANWPAAPRTYLPRITQQNPNDSIEATMDAAAYGVLKHLFPDYDLTSALNTATSQIPSWVNPAYIAGGKADGEKIAALMIAERSGDASAFDPAYTLDGVPGSWRPTGSTAALNPNWARLRPFAMTSATQFRPRPPAGFTSYDQLLRSPEYASQVNEVKSLGSATSTTRTAEQTQVAHFWANDLDGTYKPPGHLLDITATVSKLKGLKQSENAELFNLVSMALADASIVAWDAKYATPIDLWRPESAVRLADTDNNAATTADPAWVPLSKGRDGTPFSPPFPAYVSGHATFAGAWAGVMQRWFGHDLTFTATTEDPHATVRSRTFTSFAAAAEENARSRVYLGVHYQWDADGGLESGFNLGDFVYTTRRDQ
ncbi:vanadium-dependent haloperoxidase [Streptosporangium sp. NPDC000396]|uniref:vanadium-dependent haloperoxidase n=1 Tax=Streptosporangium sp. NPDC000396 TaxID=3366185 RepID=UPI0036BD66A4